MSDNNLTKKVPIAQTLEENFVPYAISVIISRAIPEIDGFKPSHRKLLYTMYKMGLLTGNRTKSSNIVGQTMKLNPHGDGAIYETMVRLTRGHDALLHPFIDSKGNFGKHFSRDMAYAAHRYTEAKLDSFCTQLFNDIDKDVVDFVDNYDGTMKEPTLLPVTFPNILVSPNQGIAVGLSSNICSFNLAEVCLTTAELIQNPEHNILLTLPAPDFTTGGQIIYNAEQFKKIYETGSGSFKVRSKYVYDKKSNIIEVNEIPYTTTAEAIIDKIVELVKAGKIREVSNVRDETDINGLKIAIELKRGTDPDKLMQKLFKLTPLEDSFACNFNVIIAGSPKLLGVKDLLLEWVAYRFECIRRGLYFDIQKKKDRLHLLKGLEKILLDIDKAIAIVRETEDDKEVVPNLMIGFGIDEIQAEFVAEIKLRNLNKAYILDKTSEIENLIKEIAKMEDIVSHPKKVNGLIVRQLEDIAKKYGQPRKSEIIYDDEIDVYVESDDIEDYSTTIFVTHDGYLKKITPQSLRMSSEQKLKEGDYIVNTVEASNTSTLLMFTDKQQVYKGRISEFEDTKASLLGEYLPQKYDFDENEKVVGTAIINDYTGFILFCFQNGKVARVPLSAYETKANRKKLINAFSDASPLVDMFVLKEESDIVLTASNGKCIIVSSSIISPKTTKNTLGVNVLTLRSKNIVSSVELYRDGMFVDPKHYKVKNIPASGSFLRTVDENNRVNKLF